MRRPVVLYRLGALLGVAILTALIGGCHWLPGRSDADPPLEPQPFDGADADAKNEMSDFLKGWRGGGGDDDDEPSMREKANRSIFVLDPRGREIYDNFGD